MSDVAPAPVAEVKADTQRKMGSGGVYIAPHKLRQMQEQMKPGSAEYQRVQWDALRKSINGLINKVNIANIKNIIPELFHENLVRGRGLFCRYASSLEGAVFFYRELWWFTRSFCAAFVRSKEHFSPPPDPS